MKTLRKIRDWLKQRRNDGYRLSETRREFQRQVQKLNTKPICLYCPYYPQIASKDRFQPSEQHPRQETTKIKHELNQE